MIVKNPVIRKIPADDRKGIIGGSQIGAIAGYPGDVTEYRAWRDYMGYKDKVDPEQQWTYDKGHILEESTAKMFEKRTGIKLTLSDAYVDPDHPFLICHPDREAEDMIGDQRIAVECKTANSFAIRKGWGDPGEPINIAYMPDVDVYDGRGVIPDQYLMQCQWYYAICGYDAVYLARLTDGELYIYYVPEIEEHEKELYEKAIAWKEAVDSGYVPPISAPGDAALAYPRASQGSKVVVDDDTMKLYREFLELERAKKEMTEREKDLKLKLADRMKDNERLVTSDGTSLLTWKNETRESFDSKKFRLEFPELAEDYITVTTRRVMRLPQKMLRA